MQAGARRDLVQRLCLTVTPHPPPVQHWEHQVLRLLLWPAYCVRVMRAMSAPLLLRLCLPVVVLDPQSTHGVTSADKITTFSRQQAEREASSRLSDAERTCPKPSLTARRQAFCPHFTSRRLRPGRGGIWPCQRHGMQEQLLNTWDSGQNEMQAPCSK